MPQKHQVAEARGANMSDFMMHLKKVFFAVKSTLVHHRFLALQSDFLALQSDFFVLLL